MNIDNCIEVFNNTDNPFITLKDSSSVVMDNGATVKVPARQLALNVCFWKTIRTMMPEQPIDDSILIDSYIADGVLDESTINKLATAIYKAAIKKDRSSKYRRRALKTIQTATNLFTNMIVRYLEYYMDTIDVVDYMGIANNKELQNAKSRPKPYEEADIDHIYEVADKVMMDHDIAIENGLARAYQQRSIKRGQALQAVATRGKVSDVDARVFPNAISTSFLEGMTNPVDMAMESRAAAMVAVYTDTVIALSEYMARQSQLVSMYLRSVDYGTNCGSTDYITWIVGPDDLPSLVGMFYLHEEDNSLRKISKEDAHLVGKEIKMRWIIGCKHTDPTSVCEVCYGGMAMNVFEETNIGHYGSAANDQKRSQRVLSVKHFLATAHVEDIVLRAVDANYVTVNNLAVRFKASFLMEVDDPKLYIPANSAPVMAMLHSNHIDPISAEPGITRIKLHYVNRKTGRHESHMLQLGKKGTELLISEELLEYSKKVGVGFSEGCYVIDISRYDLSEPVLRSIGKTHSFKEYISEFNKLAIFAGGTSLPSKTPEEWMRKMFRLVTPVAVTNFTHIATICYGITAADPDNDDYRVCRHGTPSTRKVVALKTKLTKNTLGAALAYQEIPATLRNPMFGLDQPRDISPLDVFIAPRETVERSKRPRPHLGITYHGEAVIRP